MAYKKRTKVCLFCGGGYDTIDPKQKYCSHICAGYGNNAMRGNGKPLSEDQKKKISVSLKKHHDGRDNPQKGSEKHSKAVGKATKGKYKRYVRSICEVSSRTKTKILKRLKLEGVNLECVSCGWDKAQCDIHHLKGKKEKDSNFHVNLVCVCPSCHRMIHEGLIDGYELKTFEDQVGGKWREVYYG